MGGCKELEETGPEPKKPEDNTNDNSDGITITSAEFTEPEIKIFLLGAKECGKSAIFRQLQFIYCNGFDETEREEFKDIIRINLIEDMKTILKIVSRGDQSISPELKSIADRIDDIIYPDHFNPSISEDIAKLWADPIVKSVYKEFNNIGLGDHSGFFLDSVERIFDPNYDPTDDDILKTCVRSVGISTLKFQINNVLTELVDIDSLQFLRAKWSRFNVDFFLFVVSLSESIKCCMKKKMCLVPKFQWTFLSE